MRILVLTRYEELGSSSRVRFYQYFPYLRKQGIDLVNRPFFSNQYIRNLYAGQKTSLQAVIGAYLKRVKTLMESNSFDLVWVEKELLPWFPVRLETLFHSHRVPYVVDYDDAVFHRYDMHPSAPVRTLLEHKIDDVMHYADMVIVGNEYLAERASQAGARKIEQLPSVVDVEQYKTANTVSNSIFRIGWIGSPVTASYLNVAREAINLLNQEVNLKVVLIGAGDFPAFPNVPTEILPWSEDLERKISHRFDVGIMPLVDGPFERGKCGYKLVQYMASALPMVASPVGVNQQMVEPGLNGYLATSSSEWLVAFRELCHNPQKRKMMGWAGRQKAEQMYNLQVTAPRLLHLLSSLTKP